MELSQKPITTITGKSTNIWELYHILLSNPWVQEEISMEIIKYFQLNEYKNITNQNLWYEAKVVLRELFKALIAHIIKEVSRQ